MSARFQACRGSDLVSEIFALRIFRRFHSLKSSLTLRNMLLADELLLIKQTIVQLLTEVSFTVVLLIILFTLLYSVSSVRQVSVAG